MVRNVETMIFLGLCGSLRARSFSAGLLRAAAQLAPPDVDFRIFARQGELPLFNPDEEDRAPAAVRELWNAVKEADAVVVASPEYAHGITGTMKNMLDWLVGYPPFAYKPVAVLNPAFQSYHADESILEVLRTMAADLIPDACVRIPVIGSDVEPGAIATSTRFSTALASVHAAMIAHVQSSRS